MKWSQIHKTPDPATEAYGCHDQRVKEYIRQEGGLRCVYCAVNENALGGVQAFHVEHYRPKSKFAHLEHSLSNLFYACPICNRFKSNDWPAEPQKRFGNSSYPDPSQVDYSDLFQVNEGSGFVSGLYVASKYIVERLYFNRPQLILERKQYYLDRELEGLNQAYAASIQELGAKGTKEATRHLTKLAGLSSKLSSHLLEFKKIPSYEVADVTRKRA